MRNARPDSADATPRTRGITLVEALIALALGAVLVLVAIPATTETLRRARLAAAARSFVSDLREARTRAISTGWEFRVVGFRDTTGGARANQYRVLGRDTGASWPAVEAPMTRSATQFAGPWVDLGQFHGGVRLEPGDSAFQVTFDSRGTSADAATEFNPVALLDSSGTSKVVRVSTVGGVSIE